MNKCAVLHIPLSEYAYAEDEHTLKLRLRAESGDLTECIVFYGDRVSQVEPIPVKAVIMKLTASDELFDYYEAEIKVEYTRVCYYFRISDGKEVFFYYIRGLKERITENRTEYFQFPYIRREDIIRMPRWTENAVIYHIFPDSFANEEKSLIETEKEKAVLDGIPCRAKKGGTLEEIRKNLEYIREMGINCIYLNPIFAASSYHKYDTIDYFEVDPCFGDKNDLKRLVGDCHKKGIRVILDGVFNHCGFCFPLSGCYEKRKRLRIL